MVWPSLSAFFDFSTLSWSYEPLSYACIFVIYRCAFETCALPAPGLSQTIRRSTYKHANVLPPVFPFWPIGTSWFSSSRPCSISSVSRLWVLNYNWEEVHFQMTGEEETVLTRFSAHTSIPPPPWCVTQESHFFLTDSDHRFDQTSRSQGDSER